MTEDEFKEDMECNVSYEKEIVDDFMDLKHKYLQLKSRSKNVFSKSSCDDVYEEKRKLKLPESYMKPFSGNVSILDLCFQCCSAQQAIAVYADQN